MLFLAYGLHFNSVYLPPVGLPDLVLRVHVLHESRNELDKLLELNHSASVDINFIDHVVDLGVGWILAHGAKQRGQLLEEAKEIHDAL